MRNPSTLTNNKQKTTLIESSSSKGGGGSNNISNHKTTPCCSKIGIKRGPWTPEEDEVLASFIRKEGEGRWRTLPKRAGLMRCGKSCRLRWMNYLRPSVKRGHIAPDEEDLILRLHRLLGNRWSLIAGRIPGRTDNEIKNYWNTHLSKKLISQGIDPRTHKPFSSSSPLDSPSPSPGDRDGDHHININNKASSTTCSWKASASSHQGLIINNATPPRDEAAAGAGAGGFQISNKGMNNEYYFDAYENNLGSSSTPNGSAAIALRSKHHHVVGNEDDIHNNNNNNVEEDINYCSDDVFSSFLNSLINEEAPQLPNNIGINQLPFSSNDDPWDHSSIIMSSTNFNDPRKVDDRLD